MALSANATTDRVKRNNPETTAVQVVNDEVLYWTSFLGINDYNHGTSGDIGRIEAFTGEAHQIPLGGAYAEADIDSSGKTGDTSALPIPQQDFYMLPRIIGGDTGIAVTGVTAITDVTKPVYLSDDNTMTLTRSTRGAQIGIVWKFTTTGKAEVLTFGLLGQLLLGYAGNAQTTLPIGFVRPADITTLTSGNTYLSIPAPFHGMIDTLNTTCAGYVTSGSARLGLELKIGGTLATSAFVQLSGGDSIGDTEVGIATALNIFHEGDLLTVHAGKTIVAGMAGAGYNVHCEVTKLPGC